MPSIEGINCAFGLLAALHAAFEHTDRGATQEEFAVRLSLSPTQIAKFESGKQQIDLMQTVEWCHALGAPFVDFMVQLDAEITAQLSAVTHSSS